MTVYADCPNCDIGTIEIHEEDSDETEVCCDLCSFCTSLMAAYTFPRTRDEA